MSNKYADIIKLPHHVSETRPRMSMRDRAGQFAPFAALTGYEDSIDEAARYTDCRITPDESELEILNVKLNHIAESLLNSSPVTIRHFVPDKRKTGGTYADTTGIVKKIDEYERSLLMTDGTVIPIDEITAITVSGDDSLFPAK